jgi:DNA primase
MAEAGSFAERVKQQADIVRVIGEYVRLKKIGQNFSGLCPFHSEKTPSFNVHPTKQFYHCFGCSKGGDVFTFVMEMERVSFPDAVRLIAEKIGIPIPKMRVSSPEEQKKTHHRNQLIEIHREAQRFFVQQLFGSIEGKAARAYLEDRGLDKEKIERFGIGLAPSGGDSLLRFLRPKYQESLLTESGLISRDHNRSRMFDRFRRRITFPISNESGKIVAFGCRALGDDKPKYLNSPETPIYSKGNLLYHLDKAKDAIRQEQAVIVVEGYMDAIAIASVGITNVVASCGTSLGEAQIALLTKYFPKDAPPRVFLNYDPDAPGLMATQRAVNAIQGSSEDDNSTVSRPGPSSDAQVSRLLQHGFQLYVVNLPGGLDPDQYIQREGAEAYKSRIRESQLFIDYLIEAAKKTQLGTAESKLAALNSMLPFIQRLPSIIARTEWAHRVAERLRFEEPVLRAAFKKAAIERRSEVMVAPNLVARAAKPVERRLIRMLTEAEGFRRELANRLLNEKLYEGLETEKVFAALISANLASDEAIQATEIAATLEERDRRMLFEILFEESSELTWEEAESCVESLQNRQAERELADVQRRIEASPKPEELRPLLEKKQQLMRHLASGRH